MSRYVRTPPCSFFLAFSGLARRRACTFLLTRPTRRAAPRLALPVTATPGSA